MPSGIKYSTTNPTGGIRKGNIGIGVSGSLGPTSTSGLYSNVLSTSSTTYVVIEVIGSGVPPRFYAPPNNTALIQLANSKGANVSTLNDALSWFASQTNYTVNGTIDFPNIVVDGLTCNLDTTLVSSYPNTGTTWYDLSVNNNNGDLNIGSPYYTTFGGVRTIRFSNQGKNVYAPPYDGFVLSTNPGISSTSTSFTFEAWFYQVTADNGQVVILSNAGGCDGYRWGPTGNSTYWLLGDSTCTQFNEGGVSNSSTVVGRWVQMVGIFDRANTLGGGLKFYNYVNSSLQSSVGIYNPVMSTSTPGMIACCGAFDGYISIVRVYNRALTQAEITQNWQAQRSYFGL